MHTTWLAGGHKTLTYKGGEKQFNNQQPSLDDRNSQLPVVSLDDKRGNFHRRVAISYVYWEARN